MNIDEATARPRRMAPLTPRYIDYRPGCAHVDIETVRDTSQLREFQ